MEELYFLVAKSMEELSFLLAFFLSFHDNVYGSRLILPAI